VVAAWQLGQEGPVLLTSRTQMRQAHANNSAAGHTYKQQHGPT